MNHLLWKRTVSNGLQTLTCLALMLLALGQNALPSFAVCDAVECPQPSECASGAVTINIDSQGCPVCECVPVSIIPGFLYLAGTNSLSTNYTTTYTDTPVHIGTSELYYSDNFPTTSLKVIISNLQDSGSEVLTATPSGAFTANDITFSNGTLTITGNAPASDYQAVLRTVTYQNTAAHPNTTPRVIHYVKTEVGVNGESPLISTTTINITPPPNTAPTGVTLTGNSVAENGALGAIVGTLSSTDANSNDTFTYSLVQGDGTNDRDNAYFSIDGDTLKTAVSFNYETQNSYKILVRTTDWGGLSFDQPLTVNVTNVDEAPTISQVNISPEPNTNSNISVNVTAADPEGAALSYTYTWFVNEVQRKVTSATSSNTDSFDSSLPGNGDKGQTVRVQVTVTDGTTGVVNGPNNVSTPIVNSRPVVKDIELTTWGGRALLSRPDVTDADGDALTFTYPSTPGTQGGTFTYSASSDGLFLYTPPATVASATSEESTFSVSDGTDSTDALVRVQLAPTPVGVKRYAAVGASDVQGYGASDYDLSKVTFSPAQSYAPLLVQNDKLGGRYPGIALSRRAVNGFTAFDALNRNVGGQTMLSLTNSDGARAISLWYGPNDVLYTLVPQILVALASKPDGSNLNGVATTWLNNWRPVYSAVVTSLRTNNPTAKIVAVGTPDLGPGLSALVAQRLGLNPNVPAQAVVIGRISTAITRACTGTTATTGENGINAHIASLNLPYVDVVGNADITTNGTVDTSLAYNAGDLSGDGFHPNDSGYAKIATRLWRLFNPLLNHPPVAKDSVKIVTMGTTANGQLLGTDFEGSTLTFAKATDPAHGTLDVQANGAYTYTPEAGYTGSDSFTFTASDGIDASAPGTISLIVRENVPPQVTLSSPTINQKILISNFTGDIINGTASDNVGVTSVRVRLGRKRGTANEYWNGTGFVAAQSTLNATVTMAGDQSVTWSLTGQLPPADKLDSGLYSVQVSAYDAAGNKSAYANGSFTLQADVTPPTLSITTPTSNQKLVISGVAGSTIGGTVNDDISVSAVKVRLSRKRGTTNYYWNGTDFVTASSYFDAQVTGNTWDLSNQSALVAKLDEGAYQVEAYAVDGANNKSLTAKVAFTLGADFSAPTVGISTPTSSQVIKINQFGEGTLSGVASDNIGVVSVKLKLQRKRGSITEYWNGTAFVTTSTTFDAAVSTAGETSVTWNYPAIPANLLDAGGYTLYATAFDAAGNRTTSASRSFAIVSPPSGSSAISALTSSANGS